MEVIAGIAVLGNEFARGLVDDELLVHAVAVGRLVVGIGEVADGDALGTVLATHPVAVGQIDADGSGGIEVAGKNGGGDNLGGNALALRFLKARVNGTVVFKPLGVG